MPKYRPDPIRYPSMWNYSPDDTDDYFYLLSNSEYSLSEIIEKAKEKWENITLDQITIRSEYIHTRCIYYDLYDPSDYENYLIIVKTKD